MSKVVWISSDVKEKLIHNPVYCSIGEMETIINDYNTDSGITKNDIFILGYNLALVRVNTWRKLNDTGKSDDRVLIDEIDNLVQSIHTVDHETSLIIQNQPEIHYYDLHVFGTRDNGYSVPIKMEIEYGKLIDDNEVIQFAIDNDLLDSDERHFVDYVEEIDDEEYKQMKGI